MRKSLFAFAVVLLAAVSVAAQEMRPVTYLAEFQLKPDNEADWIKLVRKYDGPMLDKLMAEGTVLAWGVDRANRPGRCPINGQEGTTHLIWIVAADYAGADKVRAGFNAMNTPPEDVARYLEVANLSNYHSHSLRSILRNVSQAPPAAQPRPYRVYSGVKVMPGKDSEWRRLFEKYSRPVLDKLMADGALYGYGVDVQYFHSEDPGWRWVWVVTTDLAAFDKIHATFDAFRHVTEAGAHRDSVFRTVVVGGPSGK